VSSFSDLCLQPLRG